MLLPNLALLQLGSIKRPFIAYLLWWLCLPVAKCRVRVGRKAFVNEYTVFN